MTVNADRDPRSYASPRGTRPRNRRALVCAAATDLFYERGYARVSIADVAESVNVGPSAIYRHFSGKADLLFQAVNAMVEPFTNMVAGLPSDDVDAVALICARTALDNRALGVLWQREARNLPEDQHRILSRRLRSVVETLATTIQAIRPDASADQAALLASCVVNAMSSISFHHVAVPRDDFERLLADLAYRVLTFEFPAMPGRRPVRAVSFDQDTRRDQLASAASILFARYGFDAVSIDDIGAAVGIAGPSVYNHFASKQDLLWATLANGNELLQQAMSEAIADSRTPGETLRRVSDSYVDLAVDHSDLITNVIAETRHLPERTRDEAQRAQRGYIARRVELLQAIRPSEDLTVSRIKVQTAQMMANSISRTGYLRRQPGFRENLSELCWIVQQ